MNGDRMMQSRWGRMFANLPRRIRLTLEYEGIRGFMRKSLRFLVRLTPLRRFLPEDSVLLHEQRRAGSWYRKHGRRVTIVIPSFGDPAPTFQAVESVRRTTRRARVKVVVVDDGSSAEIQARLTEGLKGIDVELVLGEDNVGYARNVNRVLAPIASAGDDDVVILNNDVVAHRRWLECLQFAAYSFVRTGIVGPKLLYPDNSIQFAGSYRNLGAPDWFDHRFRFKPSDFGPANVAGPVLGATGACMYIKAGTLAEIGALDDLFPMAFEDIDYCLRAWERGHRVVYQPTAALSHHESKTRGSVQGERELASKDHFWSKWSDWFERRPVHASSERLRIAYVTQDTGIGGGHRVVFEQINLLTRRGHDVTLYTLDDKPAWFDLEAPTRSFRNYEDLVDDLSEIDAVKVATWWETAEPVWLASIRKGIPVYFVQDIETSYYPDSALSRNAVLASYRPEFRYLTTSSWNHDQLAQLGYPATIVPPGVDGSTYRPLTVERQENVVLAIGRSNQLKNLALTMEAWRSLPEPRPELWLFGIEPELGEGERIRYFDRPSDTEVNQLLNRATVFLQTSRHEGFCLPLLEAMAAGTPVVCTDADGNRDFCVDRVNCLMPDPDPRAVAAALSELLSSAALRETLVAEGRRTAADNEWARRTDRLERFLLDLPTHAETPVPARAHD
jgi:glycosyltransferase involved in cell wall biosynthesis